MNIKMAAEDEVALHGLVDEAERLMVENTKRLIAVTDQECATTKVPLTEVTVLVKPITSAN